jgi:peptidoglycan hydrolase CwlO-like protein
MTMKKLISIALVSITTVALTAGSSSVFAADAQSAASPAMTTTTTTTTSKPAGAVVNAKDFQDRKTRILQHISDRLTKIQQIQACVQAANDIDALRACKPREAKEHGANDHSG